MNNALIQEIQEAYRNHKFRPIPCTYLLEGLACPLTTFAIGRGVVDKDDPDLSVDQEDSSVLAWTSNEFVAEWVQVFISGFDDEERASDDPAYLANYELGELAFEQLCRRS